MSPRAARRRVAIPESEMSWRFSRSSGPGGQSVNTTDSRVELGWRLASSTVLTDAERERVVRQLRSRIVDGVIWISSSQYKSQHRNREAAKVRLEELVTAAMAPPRSRRPTKPSRSASRRGIESKKRRGATKKLRQRPE